MGLYQVWLQGQAAGLSVASLRALDGQGRTHLATYPRDYHSPAELTESVRGTAAFSEAPRPSPAPAPRPLPATGSAGRLTPRPLNRMVRERAAQGQTLVTRRPSPALNGLITPPP